MMEEKHKFLVYGMVAALIVWLLIEFVPLVNGQPMDFSCGRAVDADCCPIEPEHNAPSCYKVIPSSYYADELDVDGMVDFCAARACSVDDLCVPQYEYNEITGVERFYCDCVPEGADWESDFPLGCQGLICI